MSQEATSGPGGPIRRLASHGAARIFVGSVIGQGLLLAVSPLLTRLYTPTDFAALTAFTALATVFGGVVTLSWERAIVVPRAEAQARALLLVGVLTVVLLGVAMTVLSALCGPLLDSVFGTTVFADFFWLLPLTVVVMGLFALMSSWLVRLKRFGRLAGRNVLLGSSQAASSVLLGILGAGPVGLLSGMGIGRALALLGIVPWTRLSHPLRGQSKRRLVAVMRRYRRFPLIATWSRVLNILGLQLPSLLLVAIYGSIEAGLYALTVRVLAAPVGMIVDAISQYFEGTFAARVRARSTHLAGFILSISGRLFLVGLAPAAAVALFAPEVFAWLFGEEWRPAGVLAQIVVAFYLLQLAVSPISRALFVLEKQKTQLVWDVSRAAVTVLCVVIPVMFGGSLATALVVLTAAQVILYLVLLLLCLRAARAAERR